MGTLAAKGYLGAAFEIGKRWRDENPGIFPDRIFATSYPDCFAVINAEGQSLSGCSVAFFDRDGVYPAACAIAARDGARGKPFEGSRFRVATAADEVAAKAQLIAPCKRDQIPDPLTLSPRVQLIGPLAATFTWERGDDSFDWEITANGFGVTSMTEGTVNLDGEDMPTSTLAAWEAVRVRDRKAAAWTPRVES